VSLIGGSCEAGSGAGNPEAVVFFRRRRAAESPPSNSATSALYAASRERDPSGFRLPALSSSVVPVASVASPGSACGRLRCSVMCGSAFAWVGSGWVAAPPDGAAGRWSAAEPGTEDRTAVVPEADGTGSRSGSAGRDGPGTDGRGVVGLVGGTGAGLVGVGAVLCAVFRALFCAEAAGAFAGGTTPSPGAAGAVWCGWGAVAGVAVRVEPVDCAGADVGPAGAAWREAAGWTLAAEPGAASAEVAAAGWAGRAAGGPDRGDLSAEAAASGFAVAAADSAGVAAAVADPAGLVVAVADGVGFAVAAGFAAGSGWAGRAATSDGAGFAADPGRAGLAATSRCAAGWVWAGFAADPGCVDLAVTSGCAGFAAASGWPGFAAGPAAVTAGRAALAG
jgi:hypothetical protein